MMGVSTDGQICFGISTEEGCEFPWGEMDDIEEWWRGINGFKDLYEPWTDEGEYAPGWSRNDPRFEAFFAHRKAWDAAHPLPVTLVNYCSGDCPMWILAVPGTEQCSSRGYPKAFDPLSLVIPEGAVDSLLKFCEAHGIDLSEQEDPQPKWWLSSYWG